MLTLACADSSQHTVNLHSTAFAVRSVQNTRSKHNQFQRKTNMTIINSITASLLSVPTAAIGTLIRVITETQATQSSFHGSTT